MKIFFEKMVEILQSLPQVAQYKLMANLRGWHVYLKQQMQVCCLFCTVKVFIFEEGPATPGGPFAGKSDGLNR